MRLEGVALKFPLPVAVREEGGIKDGTNRNREHTAHKEKKAKQTVGLGCKYKREGLETHLPNILRSCLFGSRVVSQNVAVFRASFACTRSSSEQEKNCSF